jgi:hypothetical protein
MNMWMCNHAWRRKIFDQIYTRFSHLSIICILIKMVFLNVHYFLIWIKSLKKIRFFCPQNCYKNILYWKKIPINLINNTLWLKIYKWLIIMNYGNKKVWKNIDMTCYHEKYIHHLITYQKTTYWTAFENLLILVFNFVWSMSVN